SVKHGECLSEASFCRVAERDDFLARQLSATRFLLWFGFFFDRCKEEMNRNCDAERKLKEDKTKQEETINESMKQEKNAVRHRFCAVRQKEQQKFVR
ncbi:MAG: hypothetical protein MJZ01_08600, partial [Bacteroidales bacterium]|nr:hypothetical protein [Bacteroidales bacterium]